MQLSPKILRGLNVKGWKIYEPRVEEEEEIIDDVLPEAEEEDEVEIEVEDELPPPPTREEIEKEREEILAAARKEGEQLRKETLAKAEKEATALRAKAEQEGFDEGFARGEQEAERLKEEARRILEEAEVEYQALLGGAEPEILQLAAGIAKKLLDVEMEINEEAVMSVIIRCLEALPGGREVVLRVNTSDEPLCRRKIQVLQALLRKDVSLQIVADDSVGEGSCVVESEEAEVAFHLQKELEILIKKLLKLAEG